VSLSALHMHRPKLKLAARGYFPEDLYPLVIQFLDIGSGTKADPGYITPFAWVCKKWCVEVRKRVYRRCNLKSQHMANWFFKGISDSAVPYPNRHGVGLYVTTLILSFTPVNVSSFTLDIRDALPEAPSGAYGIRMDSDYFWERFERAVVEMPNLITFGLCYDDNFNRSDNFHELSNLAHLFPTTFRNLIIRTPNIYVSQRLRISPSHI